MKKIAIAMILTGIVVVTIIVAYFFLLKPKEEGLDVTVSGSWPGVYYIPIRAGDGVQWNLTIECLDMGAGTNFVNVIVIDEYWDEGSNHRCTIDDIYSLESQGKTYIPYQLREGEHCSHIVDKDMTFFIPLSFSEEECTFHISLKRL